MPNNINIQQKRRGKKVAKSITSGIDRPRLSVFRSNKYIYAQIIDDTKGKTLVSASESELKEKTGNKTEKAQKIGEILAQKALADNITKVVFDRGSYKYHGRVKALAQKAKEKGLVF